VKIVNNNVEEFNAIGNVNLKDTAIVETSFAKLVTQPVSDSAAAIRLVKFDNDEITYEVNSSSPQFAVFSEIYYPIGWNAYLDGKKTEYCKANYILRGMSVPSGKHTIRFVFEPASVKSGKNLMFISSILVLVVFLGGLFMHFRPYFRKGANSTVVKSGEGN
jgi:uncharacterized membrane protein YfhO